MQLTGLRETREIMTIKVVELGDYCHRCFVERKDQDQVNIACSYLDNLNDPQDITPVHYIEDVLLFIPMRRSDSYSGYLGKMHSRQGERNMKAFISLTYW